MKTGRGTRNTAEKRNRPYTRPFTFSTLLLNSLPIKQPRTSESPPLFSAISSRSIAFPSSAPTARRLRPPITTDYDLVGPTRRFPVPGKRRRSRRIDGSTISRDIARICRLEEAERRTVNCSGGKKRRKRERKKRRAEVIRITIKRVKTSCSRDPDNTSGVRVFAQQRRFSFYLPTR